MKFSLFSKILIVTFSKNETLGCLAMSVTLVLDL